MKLPIFKNFFKRIASSTVEGGYMLFQDGNNIVFQDGNRMIFADIAAAPTYEAETTAFMGSISVPNDNTLYHEGTAQEITGAEYWNLFDDFFKTCKSIENLFNKLQYARFRVGTADAVNYAIDALNPGGAYTGTYFGGWIHTSLGSEGNQSNTYMTTGFIPSIEQTEGNSGMTWVLTVDHSGGEGGGRALIGADNGTSVARANFANGDWQIRYNSSAAQLAVVDSRLGVTTLNRHPSIVDNGCDIYANATLVKSASGSGSLPSIEIYEGAYNTGSAAGGNGLMTIATVIQHEGLTEEEAIGLHNALITLETGLGRKTW